MIYNIKKTPENRFFIGFAYDEFSYEREIAIDLIDHRFMSISEQIIDDEGTYLQYIYLHDKQNEKVVIRIDYFTINDNLSLTHNGFDYENISHILMELGSDYGSLFLMNDTELMVPNEILKIIMYTDESVMDFSNLE